MTAPRSRHRAGALAIAPVVIWVAGFACAPGIPASSSSSTPSSDATLAGGALYEAFLADLDLPKLRGGIRAVEEIEIGDPFGELDLARMMSGELDRKRGTPGYARWMP